MYPTIVLDEEPALVYTMKEPRPDQPIIDKVNWCPYLVYERGPSPFVRSDNRQIHPVVLHTLSKGEMGDRRQESKSVNKLLYSPRYESLFLKV